MAKYNLFLGTATGSVGDVTMYVRGGKQVSRVRRRVIANPRSSIQVAQRVIVKTCAAAYSVMKPLVSQTFHGVSGRAANQSRFLRLNVSALRSHLEEAEGGQGLAPENIPNNDLGNILGRGAYGAGINDFIISEGSLPFRSLRAAERFTFPDPLDASINVFTWKTFAAYIGARVGDQITFAVAMDSRPGYEGLFSGFEFARIVLMPSDGNVDAQMFESIAGGYRLLNPNPADDGEVIFTLVGTPPSAAYMGLAAINGIGLPVRQLGVKSDHYPDAAGCILSRRVGRGWQYSTSRLVGSSDYNPLNAAVASWIDDSQSSRYLDQAQFI